MYVLYLQLVIKLLGLPPFRTDLISIENVRSWSKWSKYIDQRPIPKDEFCEIISKGEDGSCGLDSSSLWLDV